MPVSLFRVIVGKITGTPAVEKTTISAREITVKPATTPVAAAELADAPKGMQLFLRESQATTRTKGQSTRMNGAILSMDEEQVQSLLSQINLDAAEAKPIREALAKKDALTQEELAKLALDEKFSDSLAQLGKDLFVHRCPFCGKFHFCRIGCCCCKCCCRCRCKGPKGDKGDKGDKGEPGKDGLNGTNGANGSNGTNGLDGVTFKIVNRKVTAVDKGISLDPPANALWSTAAFYHELSEFSTHADLDDIANTFSAYASGWVIDVPTSQPIPIFLRPMLSKEMILGTAQLKVEFEVRALHATTKPWDDLNWSLATRINEIHYTVIG